MKIVILLSFITLFSCETKKNRNTNTDNLTRIDVDIDSESSKGDFDKYFTSLELIPLETNELSLIDRIDKVIVFKEHFFILDKKSNSVFIFDSKGKFKNKIKKIGRGPEEYIGLKDFAINEEKEELILLSHRPRSFYTFSLEGEFISKKNLKTYNRNINYSENNILLLNIDKLNEELIISKNINTSKEEVFLNKTDLDLRFRSSGLRTSYLIKSNKLYLNVAYDNIIYEFSNQKIIPKYNINFGENKLENKKTEEFKTFHDIMMYSMDNDLAFTISDFRESINFITFKYNATEMVFYDKKTKETECTSFFIKDGIVFSNYTAHDGNDNKLISIESTSSLIAYKDMCKKSEGWNDVSKKNKNVLDTISEFDNPVLLIGTLK